MHPLEFSLIFSKRKKTKWFLLEEEKTTAQTVARSGDDGSCNGNEKEEVVSHVFIALRAIVHSSQNSCFSVLNERLQKVFKIDSKTTHLFMFLSFVFVDDLLPNLTLDTFTCCVCSL